MKKRLIWRFIDSGNCDAYFNMALDEAIALSVIDNKQPPTLRLYGWERTSVSLGAFQKYSDINIDYCNSQNIPIVRRPTGGRAILHDNELTYSFSSKNEGFFNQGLMGSYRIISEAFIRAFFRLGIDVHMRDRRTSGKELIKSPLCFNSVSLGEISFQGKKLIGSAQKRWRDGFLQQGSIPFIIDYDKSAIVFKQSRDTISEFAEVSKIDSSLSINSLKEAIVKGFEEYFEVDFEYQSPSPMELELTLSLLEGKYLQPQWVVKADSKIYKRSET
ncbi:MAG: lipoate--protein ligase family protein [Thermodesulfovibrionales bacterium]|nr:lipoate--protein ligase family protein [Thermodesulfovibrionales bacterium]